MLTLASMKTPLTHRKMKKIEELLDGEKSDLINRMVTEKRVSNCRGDCASLPKLGPNEKDEEKCYVQGGRLFPARDLV